MAVREASHAGSWYSSNGRQLATQLDQWLAAVPEKDVLPGVDSLPLPGARVVISPHAGYAYSGACAAWAYKCLDLSKAKRIFILHPSHHHHLSTAALPVVDAYETPLSDTALPLDHETIKELSTSQQPLKVEPSNSPRCPSQLTKPSTVQKCNYRTSIDSSRDYTRINPSHHILLLCLL